METTNEQCQSQINIKISAETFNFFEKNNNIYSMQNNFYDELSMQRPLSSACSTHSMLRNRRDLF